MACLPIRDYNNPMIIVSLQQAQHDLLALLRRVEQGESFEIVSGEHALAELRPAKRAATEPRPFGLCAGQFSVPTEFDQPLPEEIVSDFEGT